MNVLRLLLLLMLLVTPAWAALVPVRDVEAFRAMLARETAALESLECDFVQTKYLEVFAEKVVSSGRFYYRKPSRIALVYTRPVAYRMVLNGREMIMESEGKKTVLSLSSNKLMGELQGVLTASMVGDFSRLSSGYRMEFFEDASCYMIRVQPLDKNLTKYVREAQVYVDRKNGSVLRLRLMETGENYTEYEFVNKRYNTLKDDQHFVVR
jgi:outer membrane lipoprotein-sorting protein